MLWTSGRRHVAQQGRPGSISMSEHQCILTIQTRWSFCQLHPLNARTTVFFLSPPPPSLITQLCSEMFKVTNVHVLLRSSSILIASPVAAVWRRAGGGVLVALTVRWGVRDARAAGRRGGTGGGFGFNLQPLVAQGLREVVVDGDADGELGASLLVVQSQAPLEVLLHHALVVAFGNRWKQKVTSSTHTHTHTLSESARGKRA